MNFDSSKVDKKKRAYFILLLFFLISYGGIERRIQSQEYLLAGLIVVIYLAMLGVIIYKYHWKGEQTVSE